MNTTRSYNKALPVDGNRVNVYHMPSTFWIEYALKTKQPLQYCHFDPNDIKEYLVDTIDASHRPATCESDAYVLSNCGFESTRERDNPRMEYVSMLFVDDKTLVRVDSHYKKKFYNPTTTIKIDPTYNKELYIEQLHDEIRRLEKENKGL